MITHINYIDGYPLELPCIQNKTFEFTLGINILFGPNGCGKSTIIKTLKSYCGIKRGGWTQVSDPLELGTFYVGRMHEAKPLPHAYHVYAPGKATAIVGWDGFPAFFNDGDIKVSETFFYQNVGQSEDGITTEAEQLEALALKPSSGQYRIQRINKVISMLGAPPTIEEVERIPDRLQQKDYAKQEVNYWRSLGRRSNKYTVILDEPERSLSLPKQQKLLCEIIPQEMKNYQVIIATHSIFALMMKNVNIIDMESGYVEECKELIKKEFKIHV
jgi:energy-coupling factor transporter ATP-binding protein EcfA2